MASENVKNYTESLKNIILTLAVLVGGLWTLYIFDVKLEVENAKARLEALNRELEENPVVTAILRPKVIYSDKENMYLQVHVTLSNSGKKETRLFLGDGTFRVAKVVFKDGVISGYESPKYSNQIFIPDKDTKHLYSKGTSVALFGGQKKFASAVFNLDKPGLYQVDFAASPGAEIVEAREEISDKVKSRQGIRALDFVYVNPNKAIESDH